MKKIRMLTYWQYGLDSVEFKKFMESMNVEYCAYLSEDEVTEADSVFESIYLYNGLDFYKSIGQCQYELDEDVILGMTKYELPAIDIIKRWRKSVTDKDDYAELRKIYFIYLRYWYNFIKQREINLFVLNIMPHVPATYIPYAICKVLDIPVIMQGIMPFTAGEKINYILKPSIESFDYNFRERFKHFQNVDINKNELPIYLTRYFEQYTTNEFGKKRVIFYNKKKDLSRKYRSYIDRAKIYIKRSDIKMLLNKIKNLISIKLNSKKLLREIERYELNPDYEKPFYFFPLHLQPEATTLPNGGVFMDQMLIIRMISQSLPTGAFLYVKEHPSYWLMKERLESIKESRNKEFYEEIQKMQNVILVNHLEDSMGLIKKCKALITVTGTAGFEAIFQSKPVLLFGEAFYQYHENVFNVRTCEQCRMAIKNIEENVFQYDEKYMIKYLMALGKYVVPLGAREQNFIDNGTPKVCADDRMLIVKKIEEFYREYYDKD